MADKKRKKMSAKLFTIIVSCIAAVLIAFAIALPVVTVGTYDDVLRDFFGTTSRKTSGIDTDATKDYDKEYNKSDFENKTALQNAAQKFTREAGAEGFVLLKNDTAGGKGLPIKTDANNKTKLSLFSQSSVDMQAGGTGSGVSYINGDFKSALEAQNYTVNEKLWSFYKGTGKKRGGGALNYGGAEDWSINESDISAISDAAKSEATGTTPIFVITRTGGEGRDLARYMGSDPNYEISGGWFGATKPNSWTKNVKAEDKDKHYLEPDSVELGVIKYLNDNFDNVILIVNTNNAFELGWVANYPNIRSVLWASGAGGETYNAVADVISGKVTPSGKLVDTFAYDAFSAPAMQNMGDLQYENGGKATGYYGVSYDEGIYVGYKYYETRYTDKVNGVTGVGDYDYATTVQYPFGYGLSYTTFAWSDFDVTDKTADGDMTVSVKVKNTGAVKGKEVVEVYLQAPYTEYDAINHIEKSAVSLVGFGKTAELAPNAEETVSVTVNVRDFITYDDVKDKTYILEDGDYLLTAARDAHAAANNFLAHKGKTITDGMTAAGDKTFVKVWNNPTFDKTTYKTSDAGVEITNVFDDATLIDRDEYLSRADWVGTYPKQHGNQNGKAVSTNSEKNGYQWRENIDDARLAKLKLNNGSPEAANNPMSEAEAAKLAKPFGQKGELELVDYRGKEFDEVDWDILINQMTSGEITQIIKLAGYKTDAAKSINKPKAIDLDGPSGLNNMATHEPYSITYPSEVNIASSWNRAISYDHGKFVANDGLISGAGASGWYAPAMNIHRTPFAGRNFEYYSEDAFMSGAMALEAVNATAERGMYSFIKHFALNDQEDHRTENGLATWSNEQAIREIYLQPFRVCVERRAEVETRYWEYNAEEDKFVEKTAKIPGVLAIMSSFNRIGTTWAGGDYRLITQVLRNEWGFEGMVLTDYDNGGYMNTQQCLRAGGDVKLTQQNTVPYSIKTDADKYYARQAMKHVLYTVVNSNAMNGYIHGVKVGAEPFAYYYLILIAVGVLAAGFTAWAATIAVLKWRRELREGKGESAEAPAPQNTEDAPAPEDKE